MPVTTDKTQSGDPSPHSKPTPLLYVSFDQVPAAKGASTHITANVAALGRRFGSVILATPGPDDVPARELAPGVRQVVFGCPDDDLIGRVMTFRAKLRHLLGRQAFDVVHFRSIFEGYPLAKRAAGDARLLYEVNGLPSVELKHHHARVGADDRLLAKLAHQERACLAAADRVVTVSETNRAFLLARGCAEGKITVIPNGVDAEAFPYGEPAAPSSPLRVLYFGTLSPWQGVEVLIDALPLVDVEMGVRLTVAGPASRVRRDELLRRARRNGMADRVTFTGPLPREQLVALLHGHHACVVPLTSADRNVAQGCCPLKLLEALSAGCPVVASDLPVVRELAMPGEHLLTVPPDDPAAIALALWNVARDPEGAIRRSRAGRRRVEALSWRASTDRLLAVYDDMLASRA